MYELDVLTEAENFYFKATIKMKQKKYFKASKFFSEAEQIMPTEDSNMNLDNLQTLCLRSIVRSRFSILNNMVMSYQKIGKSINGEIELQDKAAVHDNMGLIFFTNGQYAKAMDHFSKAVQFSQGYSISHEYNKHLHSFYFKCLGNCTLNTCSSIVNTQETNLLCRRGFIRQKLFFF